MENNASPNDLPRVFFYSLVFLTLAIFFKLFNQMDVDYDLWLHIFMGKQSLLKGDLQRLDIYSFTNYGAAVINHEWLSQIIWAKVFDFSGETGIIAFRWLLSLLIIFFATKLICFKINDKLSRIIVLISFAVVVSRGISFRMHMFSYLFLLMVLYLIYFCLPQRKYLTVILLSFLFALWANLHGAFVLGLFIYFIYFLEEKLKSGWQQLTWRDAIIVFPLLATLINPYGIKLWFYIIGELLNPISNKYITEWQRFDFSSREIPFFLVLLVTWMAFFTGGRKKHISETVMLVVASVMGLSSVRHTPLFVILALPAVALHLEGAMIKITKTDRESKTISSVGVISVSVLLFLFSLFFFYLGLKDGWNLQTRKDPLPVKTVSYLQNNNIAGNLWLPLHWGGYALYHLYPSIKVSIDGRWAMTYTHEVMQDNMDFSYNGTSGKWKQILNKYSADYVLAEPSNPALPEMIKDTDWELIAKDNDSLLFRKRKVHWK
ncbi:MAG: hypothetical protein CVU51_02875 [Deltaproteobacteria bacterium HGW-Deltaproteobacteria-1]|nr:MAG: hypothetical protein CVU51_02875 [Deltaproteobacteria bacterium HGW-Deltaproteobacteria-1]